MENEEKKSGFVFVVGGTTGRPRVFTSGALPGLARRIAAVAGALLAMLGLGFLWGRLSGR